MRVAVTVATDLYEIRRNRRSVVFLGPHVMNLERLHSSVVVTGTLADEVPIVSSH